MVVSGEAFIQLVTTDEGLRLRRIAPEQVDITQTGELSSGGRIIAGVEFDAEGRRVAYWVRPVDPTAIFEGYAPPVRVPAADMVHLFKPLVTYPIKRAKSYVRGNAGLISEIWGVPPRLGYLW